MRVKGDGNPQFDFITYFSRDPVFASYFAKLEPIGTAGGLRFYVRND